MKRVADSHEEQKDSAIANKRVTRTERILGKERRRGGFSMAEMLIVMVIFAILGVMAVVGGYAGVDYANMTKTQGDLAVFDGAIRQALIVHPDMMKFQDNKPVNSTELIVKYINSQLESGMRFEFIPGATGSGGIAGTEMRRDAWKNAYGLYAFTDTQTQTYSDKTGNQFKESNSNICIAVVSSGKNGTGGPMGVNGTNYTDSIKKVQSAGEMVCNTDGIDDMGLIIRLRDGDVFTSSFGYDSAVLGTLHESQFIFGIPTAATNGKLYNFLTSSAITSTKAASVDQYYDVSILPTAQPQIIPTNP